MGVKNSASGAPHRESVLPNPAGEAIPPAAAAVFGARLDLAARYVDLLATVALERGLIGPREVPGLWDRHLLNCAVVAELVPRRARVIDVGSGAGLPGIAIALARPDLTVTLLEPMARRAAFLAEAVQHLGLAGVEVSRARAEEGPSGPSELTADVVTARALAPLDRLIRWCLPRVRTGGRLLAIKGRSAAAELDASRDALHRAGVEARIRTCGASVVEPPTTVIEIVRGSGRAPRRGAT